MVSAVGPYLNRIGNTIIAGFPLIQAAEQRWISNDLDYTGDKETIKGQFGTSRTNSSSFFGPVVKMEIKIPRLNIYSIDTLQHFYTRVEERDTKVR